MQQITMDDLLGPTVSALTYSVGDKVKIHYYTEELEYIRGSLPQLLEPAEIVEVCKGYCRLVIAGEVVTVDSEKLMRGVE